MHILRVGQEILVDRLHPLARERAGILTNLLAHRSEALVLGGVVYVASLAIQHAARPEHHKEFWILWIVRLFGFFFGVQVIEISIEFIETVHSGKVLVAVTEVVFPNLCAQVAVWFEQFDDSRILIL